jgi:hypothetical protein
VARRVSFLALASEAKGQSKAKGAPELQTKGVNQAKRRGGRRRKYRDKGGGRAGVDGQR